MRRENSIVNVLRVKLYFFFLIKRKEGNLNSFLEFMINYVFKGSDEL